MEPRGDRTLLEFEIPTRGLMGLRSNLLTASQGEAIVAHRFKEYQPYKGEIESRSNGSLVSLETGQSIAYSMNKLLDRGRFFVEPGEDIYAGQVIGEHTAKETSISMSARPRSSPMCALPVRMRRSFFLRQSSFLLRKLSSTSRRMNL